MLQQTRTEAVKGYYARFLERFPDAGTLADSALDEVYKLWEGLGYYSRARNIHRAAQEIVTKYDGNLPRSAEGLLALPGIGNYASGAIASIAFGERVPALDGNQVRVLTRLFSIHTPIKTPMDLYPLALSNMPEERCGDYNQALMDLGAMVCLPKKPRCAQCPVQDFCRAYAEGCAEKLPIKAEKPEKKAEQRGVAVVICKGRVLVRKRPEKGMLAGLYEFPGFVNARDAASVKECLAEMGINAVFKGEICTHEHVFTHRIWKMKGFWFEAGECGGEWEWADRQMLEKACFPSAMKPFWEFAYKKTGI